MAIYVYRCETCEKPLEITSSPKNIEGLHIPNCINCGGDMKRVFSPFHIRFKGKGWATNDLKNNA